MDYEERILATESGRRAVKIRMDIRCPQRRFVRWYNPVTGNWLCLAYNRAPNVRGRYHRMLRKYLPQSMLWAMHNAQTTVPIRRRHHVPFRQRIFNPVVEK